MVWYNQTLLLKALYWEAFSKSEDIIHYCLLSMSICSHLSCFSLLKQCKLDSSQCHFYLEIGNSKYRHTIWNYRTTRTNLNEAAIYQEKTCCAGLFKAASHVSSSCVMLFSFQHSLSMISFFSFTLFFFFQWFLFRLLFFFLFPSPPFSSLLWKWKMDWCCWQTAQCVWWMSAVHPERVRVQ